MDIFKLGKHPKKEDRRTLKLSNYLKVEKLPPIPDEQDWIVQSGIKVWNMFANDRYGDCVWAANGHLIMLQTALNGNPIVPTDDDILQAYASTGFDPKTGDNDNGTNELDAMRYMQRTGICGHKWGAFVEVNFRDQNEVKAANYLFGGLLAGVGLPSAEQGQNEWAIPPLDGNDNDQSAGSWGGHGVPVMGYSISKKRVRIITWGQPMDVDWDFFFGTDANGNPYTEELYAFISQDWVTDTKAAPNSLDMEALVADLKSVQQ